MLQDAINVIVHHVYVAQLFAVHAVQSATALLAHVMLVFAHHVVCIVAKTSVHPVFPLTVRLNILI